MSAAGVTRSSCTGRTGTQTHANANKVAAEQHTHTHAEPNYEIHLIALLVATSNQLHDEYLICWIVIEFQKKWADRPTRHSTCNQFGGRHITWKLRVTINQLECCLLFSRSYRVDSIFYLFSPNLIGIIITHIVVDLLFVAFFHFRMIALLSFIHQFFFLLDLFSIEATTQKKITQKSPRHSIFVSVANATLGQKREIFLIKNTKNTITIL